MPPSGDARAGAESGPGRGAAEPGATSEAVIRQQVRIEQIRTLFRQSAPVLLANVANAIIVSAVLWARVSHGLLLGWTATMTVMALVRVEMRRRYWAREWTAAEQESWGVRFTLGSLSAGALWGFAGGVLMPDALLDQVVIVFVVGGMAAGAAGTISCFMRAYYAYLIPSILPAALHLLVWRDEKHLAMMAMLGLFMVALSFVARNANASLTEAFRLRFENVALLDQVREAQESLVRANDGLSRANELLERRVQERTAELEESRRQLAEMVHESPDGIVVFDERGVVVTANSAIERISGRPASTLIGQHFAETNTLVADEVPRALEAFRNAVNGEARPPEEYHVQRVDGASAVVEVNPRLVVGPDGKRRIHTVIRDVTERHRAQRLEEEYEGRLRQAQRLESVGMLAGGVAHDFNNVLTMILSNVDALSGAAADPQAKGLLDEIRHGALQAADLTKQLLAFSRQQVLDVKPTNLARVVEYCRPMLERALGEGNTLTISLPEQPLVVRVDATQLEQALINLLVNARHAMPGGGRVDVDVGRIDVPNDGDWPDAAAGSYVRIAVSDTGTGMDDATRARVFDPFFTTKELGHGTGLGLSTVHGIVKQAAGHIRVVSRPSEGTRFEILLPLQPASAEAEVEEASGPALVAGAGGTVLVVEDQPQVQRAARRILRAAGYHVLCAENGEQALELARRHEGVIDLLVTDVLMPGLSGVELSRRLLVLYPTLAVLLVSGYAGHEITELAELGTGVHFLQKPFDAVMLTSSASAAVEASRGMLRTARSGG